MFISKLAEDDAHSIEVKERLGTGPIPAYPYYSQDYFDLEVAAIFKRTWLQMGHVCELPEPGSFIVRPMEVAKTSILITRGPDGVLRGFHNACTHRGTQLVPADEGKGASFTCRYHAWTFGYDGKLRAAPDFERFYVEQSKCNLRPVAVDVCAGMIFVNLDPAPKQGLREFLGPVAERLETLHVAKATTFAEYVYEVDANWKVDYDNFQENYHLRFIHPRSSGGGCGEGNPFGYPTEFRFSGPHRMQSIWPNPNVIPTPVQGLAFGKLMADAAKAGLDGGPHTMDYFALFPNFFIFGSNFNPFSHMVMPISATRSRGVIRLYWNGEDDSASRRFGREYALVTARDIHVEDRSVIEAGQRGLSSGALEHIHFQEEEILCRHFFHTVNDMVEAYRASLNVAEAAE